MNKLKGSSSAVKMKYLLFVFAAAVLVSLPTRVYQLLALVDTTNGFFKESDVTIPVLYGVVVVFGLLFLALSYVSKEVPSPKLPTGKNPILGVASFVMVAGLGWDMFKTLTEVVPLNQGNAGIFLSLLRNNLVENGGMFTILQFVLAFFAIVYFLVFAISHLNGKASYKEFKILALSPLCWSMTILIKGLMNAISFIKVSELLFEIFMFVFVMLFFLTFARISSGVFTENSMWGIYGYGLTASLLAAIVTIPRLVIMIVGLEAVEGNEFNFAHLATVIFILAYVFASLGVGFKEGLKARREVSEIELPDEDVVVKKDDYNEFFEAEEEIENIAYIEEAEVIEPEVIEPEVIEPAVIESEIIEPEEIEAEVIESEVVETEVVEPLVEEIKEDIQPITESFDFIDDDEEEKIIEKKEKKSKSFFKKTSRVTEKTTEEIDEGLKPISLADLKNRNKE